MRNSIALVLFSLLILSGCMKVERSQTKLNSKRVLNINSNTTISSTGAINLNMPFLADHIDFFPSSFKIESNGRVIYIDPFLVDDPKPADYILITHPHADHFSIKSINKILKDETIIVCPGVVADKLKNYNVQVIKPGQIIQLADIEIEGTYSYNLKPVFLGITPHPKKALYTGYILSIDGVRFFHAGDTDNVPEFDSIKDITVVMLPIDGGKLTMSTEDAAGLINKIKPLFAIPMHYRFNSNETKKFSELVDNNIKFEIMDGE